MAKCECLLHQLGARRCVPGIYPVPPDLLTREPKEPGPKFPQPTEDWSLEDFDRV